jgi:hypothetical protein
MLNIFARARLRPSWPSERESDVALEGGHRTATGLTGAPTAPVILRGEAVRKKS